MTKEELLAFYGFERNSPVVEKRTGVAFGLKKQNLSRMDILTCEFEKLSLAELNTEIIERFGYLVTAQIGDYCEARLLDPFKDTELLPADDLLDAALDAVCDYQRKVQ